MTACDDSSAPEMSTNKTVILGRPGADESAVLRQHYPDVDFPDPVPGSVKARCTVCHTTVWIGPRLQIEREFEPDVVLLCYICAAEINEAQPFQVVNLDGD